MQKNKWIVAVLTALCFVILGVLVIKGQTEQFDLTVCQGFYSIRTPELTTLMEGITYLGNWETIAILCILLLMYPSTRSKYGLPVASIAIVSVLVKSIVKAMVKRPRPDISLHLIEQGGYSFPSGHALTSMAVYGLLFFLIMECFEERKKKIRIMIICGFLSLLIGLTRIYLGVHFPTDVLAGWCGGIACITGVLLIREYFKNKQ